MTSVVGPEDTGRACPYCRFPLKGGAAAMRCPGCGSLHHEDCWRDGGGCAVFGCAYAGRAQPAAGGEAHAKDVPAPPVPPPPPPSRRGLAVGIAVGLAVAAAAVGGYALASRDGSPEASQPRETTEPGPEPVATTEPLPDPTVTPDTGPTEREVAQEVDDILRLSLEGREAVLDGRYSEAVVNRELVLARLRALEPPTPRLAAAVATLDAAMQASLEADIAYRDGLDPSASNEEATRLKRTFVRQYTPIAREWGLTVYSAGTF